MIHSAYILDTVRTPIGNIGGILSQVRADDLAAHVLRTLTERNAHIPKDIYDDIILGCANQAGEDNRNIARMASLLAEIPYSVPAETVNRLCASGMSAVINAARAIQCGDYDIAIAGGVEQMTRAPWVISKTSSAFGRDAQMFDTSFGWRFINPKMKSMYGVDTMGETAENLFDKYKIPRVQQDNFAVWSQQKASKARDNGRFKREISPIQINQKNGNIISLEQDEFIKSTTNIETLSKLKPAFRIDGSVTAGNSSGLNDGASACIVANENILKKYNSSPLARIVSSGISGVEPRIMGIGPVEASKKALKKAGLSLNDIDLIELNEAFAIQVLSCLQEMKIDFDDTRINVNGGAIALGHPLGMSGARILGTAALELSLTNKKFALCTMCIGVGQGYAVILEKC
jgi:acetyl-CoA acyltransferase